MEHRMVVPTKMTDSSVIQQSHLGIYAENWKQDLKEVFTESTIPSSQKAEATQGSTKSWMDKQYGIYMTVTCDLPLARSFPLLLSR